MHQISIITNMLAVEAGQAIGIEINIPFGEEMKMRRGEVNNEEIIKEHIAISAELNKLLDKLEQLKKEKETIVSGLYQGEELAKAMQKSMEEYDALSLEMKELKKRSEKLKKLTN